MELVSYTFKKEDIISQIRKFNSEVAKEAGVSIANGEDVDGGFAAILSMLSDLDNDTNKSISEFWCDMCSDNFFKKNPNVSDVLMIVDSNVWEDGKVVHEKYWVCGK